MDRWDFDIRPETSNSPNPYFLFEPPNDNLDVTPQKKAKKSTFPTGILEWYTLKGRERERTFEKKFDRIFLWMFYFRWKKTWERRVHCECWMGFVDNPL